jgi:hypothetical protein
MFDPVHTAYDNTTVETTLVTRGKTGKKGFCDDKINATYAPKPTE